MKIKVDAWVPNALSSWRELRCPILTFWTLTHAIIHKSVGEEGFAQFAFFFFTVGHHLFGATADALSPIKTAQIRASDQLRALPLTSLLSASLFRGYEWKKKTLPVQSRQFCSIKVSFTSPPPKKLHNLARRLKEKPAKGRMSPQTATSSPQLDSPGVASVGSKRGARKENARFDEFGPAKKVSFFLWAGDVRLQREWGPFYARDVLFFLFLSANEATSERGMIAARPRQNMRVRGADASWE